MTPEESDPAAARFYQKLGEYDHVRPREPVHNGNGHGVDLGEFLRTQVYPKIKAEDVFTHASHAFQKSGDKWRGGCPWHESQSGTSFTVTPSSLLWWCAGCNVGGSPIEYLSRLQGKGNKPRGGNFKAIVGQLCEQAGVPLPDADPASQERARLQNVRRAILESTYAYCRNLYQSKAGAASRAYMAQRGFGEADAQELELGLYRDERQLAEFLASKGYVKEDVAAAAVLFKKMEGYIVFPWRDECGEPLTLYGTWPARTPPDNVPKKMALPNPGKNDSPWERTKRSPYGLDRALRAGCLDLELVEGLTDAGLLQVRGGHGAIASVAAVLSELMVKTLVRNKAASVTICGDPDQAGGNGTEGNIRNLMDAGVRPYVAPELPDGLDPDDFVLKNGIDGWRDHLKGKIHGFRWLARKLIANAGPRVADDAWADGVIAAAAEFARTVPLHQTDELERHYLSEIARVTDSNVKALQAKIGPVETAPNQASGDRREPSGKAKPQAPEPELYTAAELLALDLPEPRWAVPGILGEGLSVLGGKPKLGKSWLALNMAIAVATGGSALGVEGVAQGDVLYIALEDSKRRLKDRLAKLLARQNTDPPGALTLARQWPRQDNGGLDRLEKWLQAHRGCRLVIIDTWPLFRPARRSRGGAESYEEDYGGASELKALADAYQVAILLIAHCRKAPSSDDWQDELMGSQGLAGAADATLVLRRDRGSQIGTLHLTGRDIEEKSISLLWTPEHCLWSVNDAPPDGGSENQGDQSKVAKAAAWILGQVQAAGASGRQYGPLVDAGVAAQPAHAKKTLFRACEQLVLDKKIRQEQRGNCKYLLPVAEPVAEAGTMFE